jgi:hypothetical protein
MWDYISRKTYGSAALRWARWNVERHGLNKLFALRPDDAKPPQSFDLWNLYRNVRSRLPTVTVEFGCGCSTLVMAEAMHRNGLGKLIVLEADHRWIHASEAELPKHLRDIVKYRLSPLTKTAIGGEDCHLYSDLPTGQIDLLYLDGPDPAHVPGWPPTDPISGDAVKLESQFAPHFRMIVDSRKANLAFLKRHLKGRYRFKTNPIFGTTNVDLVG